MQAHASKLAKDSEASDNRFKGFDEFMASAKAHAAAKTEAEEPAGVETSIEVEDQPYSPSAGVMVEEDPDLPDLVSLIGSSGAPGHSEVPACSVSRHRAGHMLFALPLLPFLYCIALPLLVIVSIHIVDRFLTALSNYLPHPTPGGLPLHSLPRPSPLYFPHLQSSKARVHVDFVCYSPD